ncbi:uncharacterized protein C1orf146-like [Anneissia japonica]|uniref:uncharacterized protein C1orf146-like n=1 Tax=Anneissia japonica TaxID=1529436 RepID=UPI0014255759|nr:uncharacterized protein C1orf146-like [Anneissia japonica]
MDSRDIDPVIINNSLADTQLCRCLQKQYKIRFSESTPQDSCIFPLSTVTFLVVKAEDVTTSKSTPSDEQIKLSPYMIERLWNLQSGHQNCFLILSAALHEQRELSIFAAIQQSVSGSNMKILPSHNDSETAKIMAMIAKAKEKSTSAILKQRLDTVAWKQVNEEMILNSLAAIGLTDHQCFVLQQGCGSLANIVNASKEELLECTSLATETADRIIKFFSETRHAQSNT